MLLGRLAVDSQVRGNGYGAALLADALRRAMRTGVGVRLVVVDALNDTAVRFYEHHGFRRFDDAAMRLYIAIETLRRLYPDAPVPEKSFIEGPNGDEATSHEQPF